MFLESCNQIERTFFESEIGWALPRLSFTSFSLLFSEQGYYRQPRHSQRSSLGLTISAEPTIMCRAPSSDTGSCIIKDAPSSALPPQVMSPRFGGDLAGKVKRPFFFCPWVTSGFVPNAEERYVLIEENPASGHVLRPFASDT